MNIEIANRLVELRKKNGLSQEELAEKLGLSRQAVSKWERAEASPDTDNLICLAKLYGVSLDDLLNTDEPLDEIAREVKEEREEKEDKGKAPRHGDGNKLFFDWFSFRPYGFDSVEPTGHSLIFYDENGNIIHNISETHINQADGTNVKIEDDEIRVNLPSGAFIHIEEDEYRYKDPDGNAVHSEVSGNGKADVYARKFLLPTNELSRIEIDKDRICAYGLDGKNLLTAEQPELRYECVSGEVIVIASNKIHIGDPAGNNVDISPNGTTVSRAGKPTMQFARAETKIDCSGATLSLSCKKKIGNIVEGLVTSLLGLLALIAYLCVGFYLQGQGDYRGWACWWVVFLVPEMVASIIRAIRKRRPTQVNIVFFALFAYIPCGFYLDLWHPMWLLFMAVPVWYTIFHNIEKIQRRD